MTNVFDLLEHIRQRPQLHVGGDPAERGEQLRHIELVLIGYSFAVQIHGSREPCEDFLRDFSQHLQNTRDWSLSCGPVAAIRANCRSDEEAWNLFWHLVSEFHDTVAE